MKQEVKDQFDMLVRAIASQRGADDAGSSMAMLKTRVAFQNLVNALDSGETTMIESAVSAMSRAMGLLEARIEAEFWEYDDYTRMLIDHLEKAIKALPDPVADQNVHKLTDPAVREAVLKLTDGKCTYCGTPIGPPGPHNDVGNFVVEHVVPKSKGGPDNIVNFVPACRGCNNAKGDRHVLHFISNVLPARIAKAGGAS